MIKKCPHCHHAFSSSHVRKIEEAHASLAIGKSLKFSCPTCKQQVEISSTPDTSTTHSTNPNHPQPPSLNWLRTGTIADKEILDDFSLVMILMPNSHPARNNIATVYEGLGYKPVFPESAQDAIHRMRFADYAAVVLHSQYEGMLIDSSFHKHICELPMIKRRYMYYTLIGPEFHTLYNLEALINSANLVVNEKELPDFPIILKKSFRQYDELFSPFLAALNAEGKR